MPASILPATWQIPTQIRDRLGSRVGRQRAMVHDGHLLLVLHSPPQPEESMRTGRFFWRSPAGEWNSKDFGTGTHALARHVEEFEDAIAALDRDEEQATTTEAYFQILDQLAPLFRSARHLHQVLQEARKLCPDDRDIINMRDRAYAIERNAELLYEETKNSLDFMVAKRSEQQAQSGHHMEVAAHRLNMLAAFFFPIATLTAIFGVNLQHGFESSYSPYLFLGTIGVGFFLGALLTFFVARHRSSRIRGS